MKKTYNGSCHCGAVRFQADIDLGKGTMRCNCSICTKARAWFVLVAPDRFRLIAGADAQTEYQWVPPGRPESGLHYRFCKTCGIRTPGYGEQGPGGGPFYFVAVASLDDADAGELASSIKYVDGQHGRYDRTPEDIRLL
ncbi:MAG: GFA family protein [Betaproteobacteria bacterium]|nr:GFA family protein [Betaproteobacteria bacterium]